MPEKKTKKNDPRLLVVGGSGELGRQLVAAAGGAWDVHATFLTRPASASAPGATWHPLDIADRQAVRALVARVGPAAIIHAAVSGHTQAQAASDAAFRTAIVDGGCHVAEAAAEDGARCIVMSTDLVFDGTRGNYTEEDPPNPLALYGQAKADMERALLALETDLTIARTSLILTLEPAGKQVDWIVSALRRGERRTLFTDELRCPIWSDELAAALLELARLDYRGLLHLAGPVVVSRHALGLALAAAFGLDPASLVPSLSAESGLNRPLNCTLNSSRAYALLKTPIRGVSARLGSPAHPPVHP
jgi:dTDP-4-dehydrorhamnose reductase